MAGLQRGGESDEQVGELVLERRGPPLALDVDDEPRDGGAAGHRREDHQRALGEDARHQPGRPAGSAAEIDELHGAEDVAAFEQSAEGDPVPPVAKRALGRPEETGGGLEPLTLLLPLRRRRPDVRRESPLEARAADRGEHEGAGEKRQETDERAHDLSAEEALVRRLRQEPGRRRPCDAGFAGNREPG